jgi:HD-GYP domain-containing protein (c-di-GMP phosphodiesterase class II)
MTALTHEEIAQRLDQLTELSVALSHTHDIPLLLERIMQTAKGMTHADGGTLYRTSADKKSLTFHIAVNDTLHMYRGGINDEAIDMPSIPLFDADGKQNLHAVAAYAANRREAVNIDDVYSTPLFNFSGMRKFDEENKYHCQSLLTVPMLDHEDELIGVLQLINVIDPATGSIGPFSETDKRFIEALASQAAIAISNQILISQLENLFESLVNLINIGIDEKSPNAGKHCRNVPELTMMLADAVHRTKEGPLANFRMNGKDRRELWLAGLLHDCGKITTPVHVIEKSTKLETITDRIHTIDTRFEVLKRDAEIRFLRGKIDNPSDAYSNEFFQKEIAQLENDRDFLRKANIGGERMSDDDIGRVLSIAKYRWVGVDGIEKDLLTQEEIDNLIIRGGTLTADERKIINNHISVTIRMLEALPWPKHLKNVPEYAGGHHERMDGKGYPRGLRGEDMSVQARVMAIADIFEALTARDRPYKAGKTLTESLDILGKFRLNGHIDPDLFDIFVREKVYLEFAKQFMDPSQIDEINESLIPGYSV